MSCESKGCRCRFPSRAFVYFLFQCKGSNTEPLGCVTWFPTVKKPTTCVLNTCTRDESELYVYFLGGNPGFVLFHTRKNVYITTPWRQPRRGDTQRRRKSAQMRQHQTTCLRDYLFEETINNSMPPQVFRNSTDEIYGCTSNRNIQTPSLHRNTSRRFDVMYVFTRYQSKWHLKQRNGRETKLCLPCVRIPSQLKALFISLHSALDYTGNGKKSLPDKFTRKRRCRTKPSVSIGFIRVLVCWSLDSVHLMVITYIGAARRYASYVPRRLGSPPWRLRPYDCP